MGWLLNLLKHARLSAASDSAVRYDRAWSFLEQGSLQVKIQTRTGLLADFRRIASDS